MAGRSLEARHIQDFSAPSQLEWHWGYANRQVPCTNDAGSCAYLDQVYSAHDEGMVYVGIIWATIAGILCIWALFRATRPSFDAKSGLNRLSSSIGSFGRRYLLPDFVRPVFGRTSRVQVAVLAILAGYLLIWSFVGMTYQKWITPVKGKPGVYNTRTTLGPWSDRVGVLAYALTPLSVLLSSRESLLSVMTGIPYQSFNFLHRWLGYIIFAQSALHTIGWCVVEIRLYQPQPSVAKEWIVQTYIVWGVVAMILFCILLLLSTPWGIRMTGYEAFRKLHYVLAMVYIGACWAHWSNLACFMIPSLIIWFIDRGVRLVRTAFLHFNFVPGSMMMGFSSAKAGITYFPDSDNGDVVRLDFAHPQDAWKIGQHFYLTFPQGSIWQSHPFTPLSLPGATMSNKLHSYIFRAKKGETKKIAQLAAKNTSAAPEEKDSTTPVVLSGPYGRSIVEDLTPSTNVLCIAGGTGVTFVLPVLLRLLKDTCSCGRKVELIWAIRKRSDMAWVKQELDLLHDAAKNLDLAIRIYVTRDAEEGHSPILRAETEKVLGKDTIAPASSDASSSEDGSGKDHFALQTARAGLSSPQSRHPDLNALVNGFVDNTVAGPTVVYASGPGSMISDLRRIVAGCNDGGKVWRGNERFDIRLRCDDRLEW